MHVDVVLEETCDGCHQDFPLHDMYKCYFCDEYFCRACAGPHFNQRWRTKVWLALRWVMGLV